MTASANTAANTPLPTQSSRVDSLPIHVYGTSAQMGMAAALVARHHIKAAIADRGSANLIAACANSQLDFLRSLRSLEDIDWPKVRLFHMDEYVGIDPRHPASFPQFLRKQLVDHVPVGHFYPISGAAENAEQVCQDYEALLRQYPADVVAMGWGENGHIAFNDPPYADFDDPKWVKVVELALESRTQQVGEGHFANLDAVPTHAITLTIPALVAARQVLCIVPEARKVAAVSACLYQEISEDRPGSILRTVNNATLYLDSASARGLK